MTTNLLVEYFDELNISILKCLNHIEKNEIEESVHKLRVAVKKIRFLLSFIGFYNNSKRVKNLYRPYRKIFRHTGLIRELQLQQNLLKELDPGNETERERSIIRHKKHNAILKFYSKNKEYRELVQSTHEKAREIFIKFPVYNENLFLVDLSMMTKKKFKKINIGQLHECRKTLKLVIYSKQLFKSNNVFKQSVNAAVADKLQDRIGAWHDKMVLYDWLTLHTKSSKYISIKNKLKNAAKSDLLMIRNTIPFLIIN